MNPTLTQAINAFSVARSGVDLRRWHSYVETVRLLVADLDEEQKVLCFSDARALILCATAKNAFAPLWIFSHATPELFARFLSDSELCNEFADYLLAYHDVRDQTQMTDWGWEEITIAEKNRHAIVRFANGYSWFLYQNKYEFYEILGEVDSVPKIAIMPNATLLPEAGNRLVTAIQLEQAYTLVRLHSGYTLCMLAGLLPTERGPEILSRVADLVEITIDGVNWVIPTGWRRIEYSGGDMSITLRKGGWPIFFQGERPVLDATSLSSFAYEYPPSGFDELLVSFVGHDGQELLQHMRTVEHGRLPIGLKFHSGGTLPLAEYFLKSQFRIERLGSCVVLPPVGSMSRVQELFNMINGRLGLDVFAHPDIQIQVCSAGKLIGRHAAILGVLFYLGSDRLREYVHAEFKTTQGTGSRLVIHGAGQLDRAFEWWGKDDEGQCVRGEFPEQIGEGRTDILTCRSLHDIEVVNLTATLLVHATYGGYWADVGQHFVADVEALLASHQLLGVLDAAWVYDNEEGSGHDPDGLQFFDVFSELMAYVFEEYDRIQAASARGDCTGAAAGILAEVQSLLARYRNVVDNEGKTI